MIQKSILVLLNKKKINFKIHCRGYKPRAHQYTKVTYKIPIFYARRCWLLKRRNIAQLRELAVESKIDLGEAIFKADIVKRILTYRFYNDPQHLGLVVDTNIRVQISTWFTGKRRLQNTHRFLSTASFRWWVEFVLKTEVGLSRAELVSFQGKEVFVNYHICRYLQEIIENEPPIPGSHFHLRGF